MKVRSLIPAVAFFALSGCADHSVAPPSPASIRLTSGADQVGTAGHALPSQPSFVVNDESGRPIEGVAVTIVIRSGGGSIRGAPTHTTPGSTSVGTWRLGPKTGLNELEIAVPGLAPLIISANGATGAAAKILAVTPQSVSGRVADVLRPGPAGIVTDAFENPVARATVTVTTSGGVLPTTLTADDAGRVEIGAWTLGTAAGQQTLTLTSGSGAVTFVASVAPSDPVKLESVSGQGQRAPAGTLVPEPIVFRVVDRYGNGVGGEDATLSVTSGGGVIGATALRSSEDGAITIPPWTLGRSALPQSLRLTWGTSTADISAHVHTDYNVEVRFMGPPLSGAEQALFTNAAARISAIVTGDVPAVPLVNMDLSQACGVSDVPLLNETVDDIVIYASIRPIDGPRGILARAGPCVTRELADRFHSIVGVMEFDAADMELMSTQGLLEGVITHEMLHVIGFGTLWMANSLVANAGTPSVSYMGQGGSRGCVAVGGESICATGVPLENVGGPATVGAHWREATFKNELMTGTANIGGMPLSEITTGSLSDLGYVVNGFAADPFIVPGTSASTNLLPLDTTWESLLPRMAIVDRRGHVQLLRRP